MARRLPDIAIPNITKPSGKRKLSEFALMSREGHNFSFYKHTRVRLNGHAGTLFFGDIPPRENLPEIYSNVQYLSATPEYAPEIRRYVVFVADRTIK